MLGDRRNCETDCLIILHWIRCGHKGGRSLRIKIGLSRHPGFSLLNDHISVIKVKKRHPHSHPSIGEWRVPNCYSWELFLKKVLHLCIGNMRPLSIHCLYGWLNPALYCEDLMHKRLGYIIYLWQASFFLSFCFFLLVCVCVTLIFDIYSFHRLLLRVCAGDI